MILNILIKRKNILLAVSFLMMFAALSNNIKAATTCHSKDSLNDEKNIHSSFFDTNKLITCYPNPAVSYISFKFDNNVQNSSKLHIYSFTGREMKEFNITNSLIKITLENFFRGLYVYQLRDADGKILESGKFQVKN